MTKVKTATLSGTALNWAVARAEGIPAEEIMISDNGKALYRYVAEEDGSFQGSFRTGRDLQYSEYWEAGGSLIPRHQVTLVHTGENTWYAVADHNHRLETIYEEDGFSVTAYFVEACYDDPTAAYGPTPLIAAMRCIVARVLGEEVEIPEELV